MTATINLEEYRISGTYPHFIGVWTIDCMGLSSDEREAIEKAFNTAPKGDHFYSLALSNGKRIFIAFNGEFGYTAMLPEEY